MISQDRFEHAPRSDRNGSGENLAYSRGKSETLADEAVRATKSWYEEITNPGYDFNRPGRKSGTGHFTQV